MDAADLSTVQYKFERKSNAALCAKDEGSGAEGALPDLRDGEAGNVVAADGAAALPNGVVDAVGSPCGVVGEGDCARQPSSAEHNATKQ